MELSPEAYELCDLYLEKKLNSLQLIDFENRLSNEPDFEKAFKDYALVAKLIPLATEKNILAKMNDWDKKLDEPNTLTAIFKQQKTWYAMAASILLLIGVGFYFYKPSKNDELFMAYYIPYDKDLITSRSLSPDLEEGIDFYKKNELIASIKIFEKNTSIESKIYEANAYIQLKEFAKAEEILKNKIIEIGDEKEIMLNMLKWDLALTLLAQDKNKEAIEILSYLKSQNFGKKESAEKLIKELE